jgi:hypothetical protein
MAIMPSIRWGNGWKNGACWRCCSRGSRGPRAMMIGWDHILEALFAANLHRVYSAVALKALEV